MRPPPPHRLHLDSFLRKSVNSFDTSSIWLEHSLPLSELTSLRLLTLALLPRMSLWSSSNCSRLPRSSCALCTAQVLYLVFDSALCNYFSAFLISAPVSPIRYRNVPHITKHIVSSDTTHIHQSRSVCKFDPHSPATLTTMSRLSDFELLLIGF